MRAHIKPNRTHQIRPQSSPEPSDFPPFPTNIPTAPLLRISLSKLLQHDAKEEEQLWKACCDLGFFYLDLKGKSGSSDDDDGSNGQSSGSSVKEEHGEVDGDSLLSDADRLFNVGEELFDLEVEEKQKYDFAAKGSYFGYKGYGSGIIDKNGMRDRNEFYNVSKDDILSISQPPLLSPSMLNRHRPLLKSYITSSHALTTFILGILNTRLQLPDNRLQNLHRLNAVSGDQVRFVKAPPQPKDDRRTALGAHTDFGSVTVLFNKLGGLQVRLPEGADPVPPETVTQNGNEAVETASTDDEEQWVYVRPLPGHAIINLGDAMVKFTGGILRSNIHRVVSPPGKQADETRFSLVYFSRPEDEVLLGPLRESPLIAEKARGMPEEEVISSKEWIIRRALGRRGVGKFAEGTEEARGKKG